MAIQQCPNGHQYDSSIYGNNCPFCPSEATHLSMGGGGGTPPPFNPQPSFDNGGGSTQVMGGGYSGGYDAAATVPIESYEERTQLMDEAGADPMQPQAYDEGRTKIRSIEGDENVVGGDGRKLVGLLVTYSLNPCGQVFPLYEGRNIVGREQSCDIALTSDDKVSSKHLVLLWRAGEGIQWGEDQMSSNGTFVNGEFASEKFKLNNGDVLLVGNTKFVYLAIPQF